MKYAICVLIFLCCMCGYLAYRLGYSNCRTDTAEVQTKNSQMVIKNDREIQQMVMSIPDSDNLQWLLNEWKRGE